MGRIEGGLGHVLCEECYYGQPVEQYETLRFIYPDGTEDIRRDPRDTPEQIAPLCDSCPYRKGSPLEGHMLLGSIEIVRTIKVGY